MTCLPQCGVRLNPTFSKTARDDYVHLKFLKIWHEGRVLAPLAAP
jgi:hypothetical protein